MKLAIFTLVAALGLGGTAFADRDPGGPPGETAPVLQVDHPVRGPRQGPQRPRGELRQALLDRFDRNHDGRLEPDERRKAVRALRRLARRLARQERRAEQRGQRRADRLIQKYDANGNGNVDPGELPPNVARRLQRFDRDGDGWVDGRELARPQR